MVETLWLLAHFVSYLFLNQYYSLIICWAIGLTIDSIDLIIIHIRARLRAWEFLYRIVEMELYSHIYF